MCLRGTKIVLPRSKQLYHYARGSDSLLLSNDWQKQARLESHCTHEKKRHPAKRITNNINIKVYIEHMHREKTDINVLSFFVNKEGEITTTKMLQKHAGSELGLTNCIVFYNICKRSYKYYHLLSTISTSSVTLQKALL